jgi:hypothetical protein
MEYLIPSGIKGLIILKYKEKERGEEFLILLNSLYLQFPMNKKEDNQI